MKIISFFSKSSCCCLLQLFTIYAANKSSAQIIWSAPAGQAWLTNTNWVGSVIPAATDIAQFGTAPTSATTGVGINMNGATNNGANNQAVGAIEITNARIVNFKIGNSSTAAPGTLTVNGATVNSINNVILRNHSANQFTIDNTQALGTQTMKLGLNNIVDNIINIDGTGNIIINTVITGTGKNLTLGGTGSGLLQLNAANTYDGATTVSANTLQLNAPGGGTLLTTGNITINGTGTLQVSTDQIINNIFLEVGGTLIVDNGATLTINGTLHHNGGNIILNGTGKIAYQPLVGGQLFYGGPAPQITTSKEFPILSGPNAVGIYNASGVTLHATRTIYGTLILSAGNLIIGNNDFTVSNISGGSPSSFVVTNGTGKLVHRNINNSTTYLPIGAGAVSFTPVAIGNGGGADYGVKVAIGFTANTIANPNLAVNRTWYVSASTTPATGVNIVFYYSGTAADVNPGFNTAAAVDHGIYLPLGYGWNINQAGLIPSFGGGLYSVGTTVSSFLGTFDFPMVIGNLGAVLAVNRNLQLRLQQQNDKALLYWTENFTGNTRETIIERSTDGLHFATLAKITGNTYTDEQVLAGVNYYRIKITGSDGTKQYSNIVTMDNARPYFDIAVQAAGTAGNNLILHVTALQKTKLNIVITDISGRRIFTTAYALRAGDNHVDINVATLAAGIYLCTATTAEAIMKTTPFVKR